MHVPKENRSKLDNKVKKCIFNGYKDNINGFKFWNPITKKIVFSWDVVIKEIKLPPKYEVQPKEE